MRGFEPGGRKMIMAEVVCSSSSDPRHPPANALDERTGNFWITTGMFPQMLVLKLQNNRNNDEPMDIERIKTFSSNVAKLVVESSSSSKPESFERLFEVGTNYRGGHETAPERHEHQSDTGSSQTYTFTHSQSLRFIVLL